jgi:hypothetical protein
MPIPSDVLPQTKSVVDHFNESRNGNWELISQESLGVQETLTAIGRKITSISTVIVHLPRYTVAGGRETIEFKDGRLGTRGTKGIEPFDDGDFVFFVLEEQDSFNSAFVFMGKDGSYIALVD